jgi:hypothetical protein
VAPAETFTFGRACDLTVDEANAYLHRVVGRFLCHQAVWWLENLATGVDVERVTEGGARTRLPVRSGSDRPVPETVTAPRLMTFKAGGLRYELERRLAGPPTRRSRRLWTRTRHEHGSDREQDRQTGGRSGPRHLVAQNNGTVLSDKPQRTGDHAQPCSLIPRPCRVWATNTPSSSSVASSLVAIFDCFRKKPFATMTYSGSRGGASTILAASWWKGM